MKSIRHICMGGTAAELVKTVTDGDVIEIRDDCAIGPLTGIDSADLGTRIDFWTKIFALDRAMPSIDWPSELHNINLALESLRESTDEVVIWAGLHPTEQTLRRRVHWWLKDASVTITEVRIGPEDVLDPGRSIHAPVALVSSDHLNSLFNQRTFVTMDEREELALEWTELRRNGFGVRVRENGHLSERPIDHYDAGLLSLVKNEPVRFVSVIGQAMAETGRSDMFCLWRFATLLQDDRISLTHGDIHSWRSAYVHQNRAL